jgi:hypothetical protein
MEELEVPTEHLHEKIHESAEESKEKWILYVALSTAFIAVLAAVAGLLGGHHSNEALIDQVKSSDQWAVYQAKGIKLEINAATAKIIAANSGKEVSPENQSKLKRYEAEKDSIKHSAVHFQESSEQHLEKHVSFAKSVTIFQISIAISAIAILTRRKLLWIASILLAIAGSVFLVIGLFL